MDHGTQVSRHPWTKGPRYLGTQTPRWPRTQLSKAPMDLGIWDSPRPPHPTQAGSLDVLLHGHTPRVSLLRLDPGTRSPSPTLGWTSGAQVLPIWK